MIVVTVGTHEQQFDRLVACVDKWAADHDEEVIVQTGYSTVEPKHCKWQKFYTQGEMDKFILDARIVITHGGPCCYNEVIQIGKVPIVVPRSHKLGEHIDDHQIEICREFKRRYKNIILIEDIEKLGYSIDHYDELIKDIKLDSKLSHNAEFCGELSKIVDRLFE